MTHLSLFSGIGGIDLAAEWAGFESAAVCEIDPSLRRILALNFPAAIQYDDVRSVTGESLRRDGIGSPTLVSAGFPCQPFSVAGKRGSDDDPRHLWPQVARVLREARPKWFLGENVRGLLGVSDGRVFGAILRDLADLGYRIGWGCFGADEASGAPHRRDRVFIVGFLADGHRAGLHGVNEDQGQGRDPDRGCHDLAHPGAVEHEARKERSRKGRESLPSGGLMAHPEGRQDEFRLRGEVPEEEGGGSGGHPQPCPGGRDGHGPVADPRSCGCGRGDFDRGEDPGARGHGPGEAGLSGRVVGDSTVEGRQGQILADEFRPGDGRRGLGHPRRFPPGRLDYDGWRDVIRVRPDLVPALSREEEAELQVQPLADGISRRVALKAAGNAVVPYQVLPILQWMAAYERGRRAS